MNINIFQGILFCAAAASLFSVVQAHDKHDPGYQEEIIYQDGEKIVVKTIHLNIDFKKKYEELKEKWDQRQESWNAREKEHREAMNRLKERIDVDNEEYEKIEQLLGTRLWTQRSIEYLKDSAVIKVRHTYPSEEMVMEYSFLFKNYPEDGAGLKSTRRGYALLLLELSKVERGMTLKETEFVIGQTTALKSMVPSSSSTTCIPTRTTLCCWKSKKRRLLKSTSAIGTEVI
ncbi:MAG: hypothetical protein GVY36_06650 [Verrucomicrobia bacterium]|jgi:hypothetical protein|nr:hypothetical protein [Verrucomicrobiota bacterium]